MLYLHLFTVAAQKEATHMTEGHRIKVQRPIKRPSAGATNQVSLGACHTPAGSAMATKKKIDCGHRREMQQTCPYPLTIQDHRKEQWKQSLPVSPLRGSWKTGLISTSKLILLPDFQLPWSIVTIIGQSRLTTTLTFIDGQWNRQKGSFLNKKDSVWMVRCTTGCRSGSWLWVTSPVQVLLPGCYPRPPWWMCWAPRTWQRASLTMRNEATDNWGIKVERVEIKDVKLPDWL